MAQAKRDQNFVTTLLAVSNVDGVTPVVVYADPTTHRLLVDNAGGSSDLIVGTTLVTNGTDTKVLFDNNGVLGEYTITGSGNVAMSASPVFSADITVGTQGASTGTILLKGTTSGTVTFSVADAAGTWTLKLPTTDGNAGEFLQTDGSGNTTWAAGSSGLTVGATTITGGTDTKVLFDNSGVLGEYTISGSGNVAMTTSPSFTTPSLGVASATSINKVTITAPATGSTLTIADGKTLTASVTMTLQGGDSSVLSIAASKTLTVSNTLTFTGTDSSSVEFGAGGTVLYTTSTIPLTVGSTTIASGTNTKVLYNNNGILGEYTISGSGNVAMTTSPSFTTPTLGAATATSINGLTITSSTGTLTITNGKTLSVSNSMTLAAGADGQTWTFPSSSDTVVTLGASQTLTSKTLTSPTIQTTPTWAAGTNTIFTVPTSDDTATGVITNAFNSGYSSTAIGDLVYLDSSSTWQKADADASAATYSGFLGIALEVKASGNAVKVLLQGFAYCSTAFPTFTIGSPVYMSATAGAVTQTAPTTTDSATRVLGFAVHADKMWFNPSNDYITHT